MVRCTQCVLVKNSHVAKRTSGNVRPMSALGGEADIPLQGHSYVALTGQQLVLGVSYGRF